MNLRRLFLKRTAEDKALILFLKSTFGITPKDLSHYKEALTHSSILPRSKERIQSNERLEFLGDAIIDSVVATSLFNDYPSGSEGELTKLKAKLVSRKNLNQKAQEIGIEPFLQFSINAKTHNTSLLGNALEALVGAIYLDLNYRKVEKVVLNLLLDVDLEKVLSEQKDYKSLLYEWSQQNKIEVHFNTISELKEEGRSNYEVEVIVNNKSLAKATGSSKKKAQQSAAEAAIKEMKI